MGEAINMSVPNTPIVYTKTGAEVQPDPLEAAALAQAAVEGQHPAPLLGVVDFGSAVHNPN